MVAGWDRPQQIVRNFLCYKLVQNRTEAYVPSLLSREPSSTFRSGWPGRSYANTGAESRFTNFFDVEGISSQRTMEY